MEFHMNNDAAIIVQTVRQMKQIYEQVSLLLQAADGIMQKERWDNNGSTAYYGSAAIYNASQWLPSVAQRAYTHEDYPNKRKLIAIMLEDENYHADFEPLIVGTTLVGNHQDSSFPEWTSWDSYWWHWNFVPESTNGITNKIDPAEKYPQDKRKLSEITTFSLPLIDIKNGEELKEQVIDKLLEDA